MTERTAGVIWSENGKDRAAIFETKEDANWLIESLRRNRPMEMVDDEQIVIESHSFVKRLSMLAEI